MLNDKKVECRRRRRAGGVSKISDVKDIRKHTRTRDSCCSSEVSMEPFLLGVCLRVLRAKMAYMKTVECFVAVALPLSDQPNVKDALRA